MRDAIGELIERGKLAAGQSHALEECGLLVIGCSTSEVAGNRIGTRAYPSLGGALALAAMDACAASGVFLAAQCCEHLNRALVVESAAWRALRLDRVLAVPTPQAGGAFASAVYRAMREPVLVERVQADAGMDVGGTLIGMHLRRVAVPVRLAVDSIGAARVAFATTRPPYTGGERASYKN
jgi:uncharacterized protein (TIGR01440 family)